MTQRVALVTGAMGGLGTAICQELAKAGHKVVAAYHPEFDKPDEWVKEMAEAGFKDVVTVAGDVANLDSCAAMVAEAEAKAGQVDILVNNAGITRDKMFGRMELAQWDAVISTNLTSLFNMTKQVSAKMAEPMVPFSSAPKAANIMSFFNLFLGVVSLSSLAASMAADTPEALSSAPG